MKKTLETNRAGVETPADIFVLPSKKIREYIRLLKNSCMYLGPKSWANCSATGEPLLVTVEFSTGRCCIATSRRWMYHELHVCNKLGRSIKWRTICGPDPLGDSQRTTWMVACKNWFSIYLEIFTRICLFIIKTITIHLKCTMVFTSRFCAYRITSIMKLSCQYETGHCIQDPSAF